MSKAIKGAALLTGALAIEGVLDFASGGALTPLLFNTEVALLAGGVSMEAAAVAGALSNNRGSGITVRQAAGYRQIIRGRRRTGGVLVYQSTTGSHKDQVNYVVAIASHLIYAFTGLYLDGRLVYWIPNSVGYTTRNGSNFGGTCDSSTYTGPNGVQYNFGGKVYCEARFGDQAPGDVIGGLTANDPVWAARNGRSPFGGGIAYVYIKREHDPELFPQEPEIKLAVAGKCDIYDPRTGTRGYTDNWALHVADHISDPLAGFGDPYINEDQLIAAANICDEQVALAQGTTESRYTLSAAYDTSMSPGSILSKMMTVAAGRVRTIGGEHHIFPGAWQGPSFSFDQSVLCGGVESNPVLGIDELCNRVVGTYTAPNYPYNVAGDLYDSNGYYQGQIQNNWPFAWQPTSFPQFERDPAHGYASSEDLNQDSGVMGAWVAGTVANEDDVYTYGGAIWRSVVDGNTNEPGPNGAGWVNGALILQKEIQLDWVISIAQAQRLAKIELMRSRYQGRYSLPMFLRGYQMQPLDVMNFTLPEFGWTGKVLEVDNPVVRGLSAEEDKPAFAYVTYQAAETGPDVYEWSTAEEQTVYAAPATPINSRGAVAVPSNLALVSGAATALVQPDGTVVPRIQVAWSTPFDAYVVDIQIQARLTGAGTWTDYLPADVSLTVGYISPVVSGQAYDVRIRSRRAVGTVSTWAEQDNFTASAVLSVQTGAAGIGPGSLIAIANPDGTAKILCQKFTAQLGTLTPTYFPSGPVTLSKDVDTLASLQQQKRYYVYVVDPSGAGGDLGPAATLDPADFRGKPGYWLIDSIVTPYANSAGNSNRFAPSVSVDGGTQTTTNPDEAYDGDTNTCATVSGSADGSYTQNYGGVQGVSNTSSSYGTCSWSGFPNYTSTTGLTLTVIADLQFGNSGNASAGSVTILATIGSSTVTLIAGPPAANRTTYSASVPAGANLSQITIVASANPGSVPDNSTNSTEYSSAIVDVYEIYIS